MPLSEREQRLLAQMEAALSAEDPKLVSTLTGKTSRPRPVLAIALVFLGIGLLLAGLISQLPPAGIAGFISALAGTYVAISSWRKGAHLSLIGRIEERWQERER